MFDALKRKAGLLVMSAVVTVSAHAAEVTVSDQYVRGLLPGKHITAAFMTLSNSSEASVNLVSASLKGAKKVEIHTHSHEGGVMRMRQIEKIEVPAKGQVKLAPGGLHLMIFGVDKLADKAEMELCFSNDKCQAVVLPVKSL